MTWPERYPGALAAGMRIIDLREELQRAERTVRALDEQRVAGHAGLDRLREHQALEAEAPDPDALDDYEAALADTLEARERAAARAERIRSQLDEAERLDLLGEPPVVVDWDSER